MIPSNIKNIIFDLGGVIVHLDQPLTDAALAELSGLSPDEFRTLAAENLGFFQAFERGEMSETVFLQELQQLLKTPASLPALQKAWNSMLLELPAENVETLRRLGDSYRLFMFSNTNEIHIAEVHNRLEAATGLPDFSSLFEEVYYSQRLGARKPEARAFRHILETHRLQPAETLFVDDNEANIQGARALGIQTWHYPLNELLENAFYGEKK